MKKSSVSWKWAEGQVDPLSEHIELRYGDAKSGYKSWQPIVLVGRPKKNTFPVAWMVNHGTPEELDMITAAHRELDFYLLEVGGDDPWSYACYHCGTSANMYSQIHWSYFPDGQCSKRLSSAVIKLSAKEAEELFGKPERNESRNELQGRRRKMIASTLSLCCKDKGEIEVKTKLNIDHALFQKLKENPPQWWKNLKADPELYIDIRKDNYLNVYHNGGSIMKLEGSKDYYKAKINEKYIPLEKTSDYLPFEFQDGNISLNELKTIDINNFEGESLKRIKERVCKFYPNDSEKGIQGKYVITAKNKSKSDNGFFIDTEIHYDNRRIDMVWVDLKTKKIVFVELKTIGDERLYIPDDRSQAQETIVKQLSKYYEFARENKDALIDYYNIVYCIKKALGILPKFVKEDSLENYALIEKPILLVGDCTQKWIKNNADELNKKLKNIAFGCVYHGKATYNFRIPDNSRNNFRLDET